MRTSQTGLNLIKLFEGLHDGDLKAIGLQPKLCPAGIYTEGYGRAMRDKNGKFVKDKDTAYKNISIKTIEQANKALTEDAAEFEKIVSKKLKVVINQNQFDALVSHTYNTGGSEGLFKLINSKAKESDIRNWFESKYIRGGGKILPGLVNRRKTESNLYFGT